MEGIQLKSKTNIMMTVYRGNELAKVKSLMDRLEPDMVIPLHPTNLNIRIIKMHSIVEADPGSLYETTYTIKLEGELI